LKDGRIKMNLEKKINFQCSSLIRKVLPNKGRSQGKKRAWIIFNLKKVQQIKKQ